MSKFISAGCGKVRTIILAEDFQYHSRRSNYFYNSLNYQYTIKPDFIDNWTSMSKFMSKPCAEVRTMSLAQKFLHHGWGIDCFYIIFQVNMTGFMKIIWRTAWSYD